MQVITGNDFIIEEPCAIAIGKFDGIHKGHQWILDELLKAGEKQLKTVVLSFEPSPEVYFGRQEAHFVLTEQEKQDMLASMGIDYYILYPFHAETAKMEAEVFLEEVLLKQLNMKHLVAGDDLSFGYKGKGNGVFLKEREAKYGYTFKLFPKLKIEDEVVSASSLRTAILSGNIKKCTLFMGREFEMSGTVCKGNQIGHKLGFPTCNFVPSEEKLLPPKGVYVTLCDVDGKTYPSVTNVGVKPTVEGESQLGIECHLLDCDMDLYGKEICVRYLSFLRPEKKFNSLDALSEQIKADKEKAKMYFEKQ